MEQRSLRHHLVDSGRGDAKTGRHGAHGEQAAVASILASSRRWGVPRCRRRPQHRRNTTSRNRCASCDRMEVARGMGTVRGLEIVEVCERMRRLILVTLRVRLLPKLRVAGSNPVSRSNLKAGIS